MRKTKIRNKIIESLVGHTDARWRVGINVKNIEKEADRYPYIEVFTPIEDSEIISRSILHYQNLLTVSVEITVQAPYKEIQEKIDMLCEQVRDVIEADIRVGELADFIELEKTTIGYDSEGAFNLGRAVMTFKCMYQSRRKEDRGIYGGH